MTTCADDQSIVVPTHSWFQKIAIRHSHSYHPLVNAKTWIRLPFGLVYGISTVVAGAGIIVSGCTADAGADFKGQLCYLSIRGGTAVMASSGEVVKGTLRPDLRHWEDLPAAIFISSDASKGSSTCRKATETLEVRPLLQSS
jgi:hypothetical protein